MVSTARQALPAEAAWIWDRIGLDIFEGGGIVQGSQSGRCTRPDEDGRGFARYAFQIVDSGAISRSDLAAAKRRFCEPDGKRNRSGPRWFRNSGEDRAFERYNVHR